jgi:hypothetical protein
VALQHFLDLGERLLAEVRRAQQLDLGLLNEIADVVDVLGLEAVCAADRELELVLRSQQQRFEVLLRRLVAILVLALQIDEHRQLILEDAARADRSRSLLRETQLRLWLVNTYDAADD